MQLNPSSPEASGFTLEQRLQLYLTPGIGNRTLANIRTRFQSYSELIQYLENGDSLTGLAFSQQQKIDITHPNAALQSKLEAQLRGSTQRGAHILYPEHPDYPELLRAIPDPPELLWAVGNLGALNKKSLAIVGGREPSALGRALAQKFAADVVAADWAVSSGLARGIDGFAHESALERQGCTLAVLGTGIDQVYPYQNRNLFRRIPEQGGLLLSEFPLGTLPKPGHFPRRNRIISGLSLGVLVIEAAIKSGSLVTARMALEQGREVFAVPGAITNPMAKGCHHLIKEGAALVESIEDVFQQLPTYTHNQGLRPKETPVRVPQLTRLAPKVENNLSTSARQLLTALGMEMVSLDELVDKLQRPIPDLVSDLLELELQGLIDNLGAGYRVRA